MKQREYSSLQIERQIRIRRLNGVFGPPGLIAPRSSELSPVADKRTECQEFCFFL